jgi:glycogen operon protein
VQFALPKNAEANGWRLMFDTNLPDAETSEFFPFGAVYQVTGRSILAFELVAD